MNPVKNILGNDKVTCFKCGKKIDRSNTHYWYHGDQDDLVCTNCAKKLKHNDTSYAGMNVIR